MPEATIILYGNAIFTATDKNGSPFAGGVAIQGDKIIAVGSKEEISQYQGPQTKIYHCGEDSLIMPGFNDGHQHLRMIIGTHHGVPLRYLTSEEAQCNGKKNIQNINGFMGWVGNIPNGKIRRHPIIKN